MTVDINSLNGIGSQGLLFNRVKRCEKNEAFFYRLLVLILSRNILQRDDPGVSLV